MQMITWEECHFELRARLVKELGPEMRRSSPGLRITDEELDGMIDPIITREMVNAIFTAHSRNRFCRAPR
ncbi:hypothetical protein AciX9_3323 [Granulicella tundricola MP5ACTX9]|uniref:Uncharacterized protein n=1 Tax=Granulicella tundricola (strain ATCC BAA-1859 / DSM 23138 / MP5ACTX9) TaxID=1198114 RepID=E8X2N5_GRATM|nr:hypothetical protein AciX9_3323 [Granulicella tundricola MP5ACTX9]